MIEEAPAPAEKQPISLTPSDLLGFGAFSFIHAFAMIVSTSDLLTSPLVQQDYSLGLIPNILYSASLTAVLLILGLRGRSKARAFGAWATFLPLALGAFAGLVVMLSFSHHLPLAFVSLGWIACGAANGFVLLRAGLFCSVLGRYKVFASTAVALLVAGAICILLENVGQDFGIICTFALLLGSCTMLLFTPQPSYESSARPTKRDALPSELLSSYIDPDRSKVFFLIMFFYCLVFGFSVGAPFAEGPFSVNPTAGVAPVIGGAIALLYVRKTRATSDLFVAQWALLALLAAGTTLLLVDSLSAVNALALILLWVGFSCYDISNWCSLFEASQGKNAAFVFGVGRALFTASLALGRFLRHVVDTLFSNSSDVLVTVIIFVLCAFFLCVILSNMPLLSSEGSSGGHAAEPSAFDSQKAEAPANALPGSLLQDAVDILASESGLTSREKEIFELLAKGRNVDYIQGALIISRHTVRSHVYHIYQKLDVHSHQELIDLVEASRPPRM